MRMKKCMLIGLICLLSSQWMWGQHFPQMDARNYVSDTALFIPRRPWLAASEVFGMNMAVWTFDRFLMNEDFAKINGHTIKQNFKTGPVWDTDKFSTNLVAHPYHGSLYFNAALIVQLGKRLTKQRIMGTIELLQTYRGACSYNVGASHVLGALAVELEEIL